MVDTESRVYKAVYSGIPVYEMECRGVAVMRRYSDSWLNATQILKVAGIDKGRRTKILEREVLIGEHEKVQGGYGKYQGTWVPFMRGVQLCEQYGVMEYMRSILEHSPSNSKSSEDSTPTKAQMKKQLLAEQKVLRGAASQAPLKRKKSAKSEADPQATMSPRANTSKRRRTTSQSSNLQTSTHPSNIIIDNTIAPSATMSRGDFNIFESNMSNQKIYQNNSFPEQLPQSNGGAKVAMDPSRDEQLEQDRALLMSMFLHDDPFYIPDWLNDINGSPVPQTSDNERPHDIDIVIDDQGHTAVHWAAALGRIQILDLLLAGGADARRLNYAGESALIRAVKVTNNYESQTFPDLLELLHDAIPLTDMSNQTVLHHITLAAGEESREKAARYYMESLLAWIARLAGGYTLGPDEKFMNGGIESPTKSNNTSSLSEELLDTLASLEHPSNAPKTPTPKILNGTFGSQASKNKKGANTELLKGSDVGTLKLRQNGSPQDRTRSPMLSINNSDFTAFLDLQDRRGDTALNIAALNGDRVLIKLLLNVGASPYINNRVGLRPVDYGVLTMDLGDENGSIEAAGPKTPQINGTTESLFKETAELDPFVSESPLTTRTEQRSNIAALGTVTPTRTLNPLAAPPCSEPPKRTKSLNGSLVNILRNNIFEEKPGFHKNTQSSQNTLAGDEDQVGNEQENDMWNNVQKSRTRSLMKTIQTLVDDLDGEFQAELQFKQDKFSAIHKQLKMVTNELSEARETIFSLNAKVSQLTDTKDRVKLLEEALKMELDLTRTSIEKALPKESAGSIIDSISRMTENADMEATIEDVLKKTNAEINELTEPQIDLYNSDQDKDLSPEKLREKIKALDQQIKVYMRRDTLMKERLEILRQRAEVSQREKQYRKIIASCCEISEGDVDLWIDRLATAVESESCDNTLASDSVNSNTEDTSPGKENKQADNDPFNKGLNLHMMHQSTTIALDN